MPNVLTSISETLSTNSFIIEGTDQRIKDSRLFSDFSKYVKGVSE